VRTGGFPRAFAAPVLALVCGAALVVGASLPAGADDVRVDADTAFQIYEVRSPGAAAFLARRRLVQTLGLTYARALDDESDEPATPRLSASVRIRLDQELGEDCLVSRDLCYLATRPGDTAFYQPLAEDTAVDAPEAWVEVSRLPLGTRVRAGRHLRAEPIGLVRLDGATARAEPSPWVAAEAYGGLLVRRTSLAGTDAFIAQGDVRRELEVDPARAPFVEPPVTTWLTGGLLELGHRRWLRVTAGFREMREEGSLVARRASLSAVSQPIDPLRLSAAGVWDVHDRRLVDAWAEASVEPTSGLVLRASAERHVPVFDWGTIWAYFQLVPIDEARVGATLTTRDRLTVGAGVRARHAEIDPGTDETDFGGEAHGTVQLLGARVSLSGFAWAGDLGPLAALMLDLTRPLAWWVDAELRASLWHFDDPLRGVLEGTSISEALGVRFRMSDATSLRLELGHAHSRVIGHRFRLLVALSVEVWK